MKQIHCSRLCTAIGIVILASAVYVLAADPVPNRAAVEDTAVYKISWHTVDAGGVTFCAGGDLQLGATVGQPDAGEIMTGGQFELIGGFWAGAPVCTDTTTPEIRHSGGLLGQTSPCSGYMDPRLESDNDVDINQGIGRIWLEFTEPMYDVVGGGTSLTSASFTVFETGGANPPSVLAVNTTDNTVVEVVLDRIISVQEWTTVVANVQDATGNGILSSGNLGPGQNEPDRVDIEVIAV